MTETSLQGKGGNEGKEDRKNKMNRRLMKAKEQAKKRVGENKFKKSENITKRASVLETQYSSGPLGVKEALEKLKKITEKKGD